jgi:hypothetical protein
MARWALDAAGLLVSLLTLLLMLAWADSHRMCGAMNERAVWQHSDGSATVAIVEIESAHGGLGIEVRRLTLAPGTDTMLDGEWEWPTRRTLPAVGYHAFFFRRHGTAGILQRVGVLLESRLEGDDLFLAVVVPYFIPLSLTLPLSIWWIVSVRRRWRSESWRRAGRCLHCGYDLRGSTDGVCPECGLKMASDATSPDSAKLVAPTDRTLSSPP